MNFLEYWIITRFSASTNITTDNSKDFSALTLVGFCFNYGIILSHSSNYYPQGNGLAELSNKNLMNIVKKIAGENKKAWDSKIKYALWEDYIMKNTSTGKTPFELVYGLEDKLPINIHIPTLRFEKQYIVDIERGVNQYQVKFKTFFNLYLNHSTISNEQ
jgi:hypothetical protein